MVDDTAGDLCDADLDNDGFLESAVGGEDLCPNCHTYENNDVDSDGIGDACDNCPYEANPEQIDSDQDGIGEVCDVS